MRSNEMLHLAEFQGAGRTCVWSPQRHAWSWEVLRGWQLLSGDSASVITVRPMSPTEPFLGLIQEAAEGAARLEARLC